MGAFTTLLLLTVGIVTVVMVVGISAFHWLTTVGRFIFVQWGLVVGFSLLIWFVFWLLMSFNFGWEPIYLL